MKIEAQSLSFSYAVKSVLQDVDFVSEEGQLTVVLGANGSGKSTLLRLLAGYLKPTAGTVAVDGRNPASLPARERARMMTVIPQLRVEGNTFSVFETVAMGAYHRISLTGRMPSEETERVKRALEIFGLEGMDERSFASLSGGEMQLAAAAQAYVQALPGNIVLADEPTSMLDPSRQQMMADILTRWKKELSAIVMTTHNSAFAARYADRVVMLSDGRIIADGTPEAILTTDNLTRIYGCPPDFAVTSSGRRIPIF